uniref:protein-lysine N-methyltransferase EEF2KMT isoform X4 n=1 Tax=Jaculus jaculus TaxID=51337 RepID=UPI001E1B0135|nr:protein-lysine N-methyltransferase EEF2KMT isoform X4 [Jaculus jaculus]
MASEGSADTEALVQTFERRFLAARTLHSFPWQSLEEKLRESSDAELLLDILQKTVKHSVCEKHPPSVKYSQRFLSELIKKPSGASITLSESTAIVSCGTTGLVTWDAALYLAEWAIENPATFTNRAVLELGSGAGLTGLAICKMCQPREYVFSDHHSHVLEQLHRNVLLNGLSAEPEAAAEAGSTQVMVAELDWDEVTASQLSALQPDVVIAADVLYCPEVTLSLVRVLKILAACQSRHTPDVYVAYTVRSPRTNQLFSTELDQAGIYWEEVPPLTRKLFPYQECSTVEILKLTLQGHYGS